MFPLGKRSSPASARSAERREREDAAPRLASEVRELVSLRLEIDERPASGVTVVQPKYVRIVNVPTAPALFLIPCGDEKCIEGGHDVTDVMLHALRAHRRHVEGDDPCVGSVGTAPCTRVLYFAATAAYRA